MDHFCKLRNEGEELSQMSSQYRQLEFGLKELYRMLEYLHNYCTLNRTAIDKILKKHDKHSDFESRTTVKNAISGISFFKEEQVGNLRDGVEVLWRMVALSSSCYALAHGFEGVEDDDGAEEHSHLLAFHRFLLDRSVCACSYHPSFLGRWNSHSALRAPSHHLSVSHRLPFKGRNGLPVGVVSVPGIFLCFFGNSL